MTRIWSNCSGNSVQSIALVPWASSRCCGSGVAPAGRMPGGGIRTRGAPGRSVRPDRRRGPGPAPSASCGLSRAPCSRIPRNPIRWRGSRRWRPCGACGYGSCKRRPTPSRCRRSPSSCAAGSAVRRSPCRRSEGVAGRDLHIAGPRAGSPPGSRQGKGISGTSSCRGRAPARIRWLSVRLTGVNAHHDTVEGPLPQSHRYASSHCGAPFTDAMSFL